ncbi:MAG: DUF2461 domain-containing protein [Oscillospiraceae bacterium]|jgi:uncharacterized protein (DUF2461 family)|nr:DUF2461 domain-containing protein [Oscillospiraceae bacterium]
MTEMEYRGITAKGFLLLAENRFRNSQAFYEEHKAHLKQLAVEPMRQIAQALCGDMAALDDRMVLQPSRMVSRLRRDTRFTNDKALYRSNMWCMFRHPRDETAPSPCFWFEVVPEEGNWSCGIFVMNNAPRFMAFLRQRIGEERVAFLHAAEAARALGAHLEIDAFKKERVPEADPQLKPFLNAKSFHFMFSSNDLSVLGDARIIALLRAQYQAYAPLYRLLLDWTQAFSAGELNE